MKHTVPEPQKVILIWQPSPFVSLKHHDATVRKYVKILRNAARVGQGAKLETLVRTNPFNCAN